MNLIEAYLHLQAPTEYVGSYLEFYSTLYGLKAGEQFFGLFWNLGLFKLPFAVMAIVCFWEGAMRGGHDGAWHAVKTLGYRFAVMYFALLLFAWPAGKLSLGELKYAIPAQFDTAAEPRVDIGILEAAAAQSHGSRGFKLDGEHMNIKVPIVPRLAMMLGHGLSRATTKVLPDQLSMRLLDQGMAHLNIGDPTLKNNIIQFNQQCYIPAVNKWQTFWSETGKPGALTTREEKWKLVDVSWLGSRILLETEGLYRPCGTPSACGSSLQASTPVSGFPYLASRDGVKPTYATTTTTLYGRPYCDQWWNDIKTKIYNHIEGADLTRSINKIMGNAGVVAWYGVTAFSPYDADEQLARWALAKNNVEPFSDDLAYTTGKVKHDGFAKSVSNAVTGALAWTGEIASQPLASAETLVLNNMAQIIQSFVLLVLYLLLPFVALFSGLNIRVMATYCILILSVIGWQMWWTIVLWIDANLLISMYPEGQMLATFGEDLGSKRMLIDRVTNGAAQYGPPVWSFILTFAGYQGIGALDGLTKQMQTNASKTAQSAAVAGLQVAQMLMNMLPGAGGAAAATASKAFTSVKK